MNDRFGAQLRQHLLGAAEERPADGQLAALNTRVAITAQRRPLVARLLWNPGRIGPFPSTAVRLGLIALALVLATVSAAIFVAGGGLFGKSTVFEDTWTSTDIPDGSAQTLVVGAGLTPTVHFEDAYATGDACRDDTVKLFKADGTGAVSGNRLDVSWPNGGGCILRKVAMGDGSYSYDPATDSLRDGQGLTWYRARGGDRPATQAPATDTPATQAPATQHLATQSATESSSVAPTDPSNCIDLYDAGGTYSATVGTLSVEATVPAGWHGPRDQFYLVKAHCLFGGSTNLEVALVTHVYADSCHSRGAVVEAASPAAVIAALAAQVGHETIGPTDATIGGYSATRFDIAFPADFDAETACDDGTMRLFPDDPEGQGMYNVDPGTTLAVYVVDVDGSAVVVAARISTEDLTADNIAELDAVVDSLRFGP